VSPGLLQLTAVRHRRRTIYFDACCRCRTLPPAWSQAPVGVTTSHQCYGSCTSNLLMSALCSRSRGSYISRSLERLPRTSQTTVAFCRTWVVAHCGPTPMTCGNCSCREHITSSVIGVSQPPVLDCGWNDLPPALRRPGLTFDSFRLNLWKLIYLATETHSDSFEFIGAIEISLFIYIPIHESVALRFFWPTLYMENHKVINSWRWLSAASVAVHVEPVETVRDPVMLTELVWVDEEIKLMSERCQSP